MAWLRPLRWHARRCLSLRHSPHSTQALKFQDRALLPPVLREIRTKFCLRKAQLTLLTVQAGELMEAEGVILLKEKAADAAQVNHPASGILFSCKCVKTLSVHEEFVAVMTNRVLDPPFAIPSQGASEWLESEKAQELKKKAADMATEALGDEMSSRITVRLSPIRVRVRVGLGLETR